MVVAERMRLEGMLRALRVVREGEVPPAGGGMERRADVTAGGDGIGAGGAGGVRHRSPLVERYGETGEVGEASGSW
jgi:hypothetical protein